MQYNFTADEKDEFGTWMNLENKQMLEWAAEYFQKKGVAKKSIGKNESIEIIKENILKQAFHYFPLLDRREQNQEKLSQMKRSWEQYNRRKQNAKKVRTISVDNEIYLRLEAIKKTHNLKNFGEVIGSIIDGEARKRELITLEQNNQILKNRLNKSKEFEGKFLVQKDQLKELQNRIDLLEKNNTTLIDTIQTLNSILNIDSTTPKIE
ncbi:MAG: hypothetical protein ACTH5B_07975 [Marinomonas sp.]|uniref:hypothetical protein n=1 Tax=Marinomonas sp. TaxID=1904862 RepID=UPI003F952C28